MHTASQRERLHRAAFPGNPDDYLRPMRRIALFILNLGLATASLCYFLPANRILAVNARDCPPENAPKLGASTLLTTVLGF